MGHADAAQLSGFSEGAQTWGEELDRERSVSRSIIGVGLVVAVLCFFSVWGMLGREVILSIVLSLLIVVLSYLISLGYRLDHVAMIAASLSMQLERTSNESAKRDELILWQKQERKESEAKSLS